MNTPRPKLRRLHIVFIFVFLAAAVILRLWQYRWPTAVVELAGEKLQVQVANTAARQIKGLGDRDTLNPYDGMLFLFSEPDRYAFVMRDMRFSIDIIWLSNGAVVDIAPSVPLDQATEADLRRYSPRKEADMVLEVEAGWAQAHGLKIGDTMAVIE